MDRLQKTVDTRSQLRFIIRIVTIIVLASLVLTIAVCPSARAVDAATIEGQVVNSATDQPIVNATVAVWEITERRTRKPTGWITETISKTLIKTTQTGINGEYTLFVPVEGRSQYYSYVQYRYQVYAYYDDPITPGHDYVPAYDVFSGRGGYQFTFRLAPAASVVFEEDPLFVDAATPPASYRFTPITTSGLFTHRYGTASDTITRFIEVDPTHVIVPINVSFRIDLEAETERKHTVTITDARFIPLHQGRALEVSLRQLLLPYNLNLTETIVLSAEQHLSEAEQKMFYVEAEHHDLNQASILIVSAVEKLADGLFRDSYADLRQAYLKAVYVVEKLQFMYGDAIPSTVLIILFLAFSATALSYLLFEERTKKIVAMGGISGLFLSVLSQVYVGVRLLDPATLLSIIGLAILCSFFFAFVLPRLLRMTTTVIFAMAKRNLRTRRTRFVLTLLTVTIFVTGFVAFTSFSTEYGFTSMILPGRTAPSDGVTIRQSLKPLPSWNVGITTQTRRVSSFIPLPTSTIEWLMLKPEVSRAAPKVENWPSRRSLGSLSSSRGRLPVWGILGIHPSTEAEFTGFDNLLVEGRYLSDDDVDAILISKKAAETHHIEIGENVSVFGSKMQVVGLLDDTGLSQIRDVDGSLMLPEKLYMLTDVDILISWWLEPCFPSEVLVLHWQTALQLSLYTAEDISTIPIENLQSTPILVSRINILAKDSVDPLPFARQLALEGEYWVWATIGTSVHMFALKHYVEVKGLFVFIPWFIVILNVVVTMVNAIYERRREILILSSVGMNPTHLTSLFGAEAVIIGVVGGGIGYLLGLSLYKFMLLLPLGIIVRQKISAIWSVASLGIAVVAVMAGVFLAMRFSTIITPSLLRKWRAVGTLREGDWMYDIPVKVPPEGVNPLFDYIEKRLHQYENASDIWVDRIKRVEEETPEGRQRAIVFTCHQGRGINHFLSRNQVVASLDTADDVYTVRLVSQTTEEKANTTARFVRSLFLEWSTLKKR